MKPLVVFVLLCSVLGTGCTTLSVSEYTVHPFEDYESSQVKEQVGIAIHPLVNEREQVSYFGVNLSKKEMLPVFVLLENKGTNSSYLVDPDQVTLGIPSDSVDVATAFPGTSETGASNRAALDRINRVGKRMAEATGIQYRGSITEAEAIVLGPAALVLFSALVVTDLRGAGRVSDNSIIKYSVTDKALKRSTLSPGESVQGFVYFQIPDHIMKQSMQADVFIRLKQLGADGALEYELAVELPE